MKGVPIFTSALVRTECDICNDRFDTSHGGVCAKCNRILCMKHLHGSWFHRLAFDLGGKSVCVECRSPTTNP
jgi:hypothetical protein